RKEPEPPYAPWVAAWQQLEAQKAGKEDPPPELVKQAGDAHEQIDRALLALARLPRVQTLLLERFAKDPAKWPTPTVAAGSYTSEIPAASIQVNAKSKV